MLEFVSKLVRFSEAKIAKMLRVLTNKTHCTIWDNNLFRFNDSAAFQKKKKKKKKVRKGYHEICEVLQKYILNVSFMFPLTTCFV